MAIPNADTSKLLERGVWKAPWMGPNGELVLLAVTSGRQLLVPPAVLVLGSDYIATFDALWELLEARDPLTVADHDTLRRRRLKAV
jgi:hypothetical protein